jgi:hypothetical protein
VNTLLLCYAHGKAPHAAPEAVDRANPEGSPHAPYHDQTAGALLGAAAGPWEERGGDRKSPQRTLINWCSTQRVEHYLLKSRRLRGRLHRHLSIFNQIGDAPNHTYEHGWSP